VSKRAAIYCRISRDREGAGLGVERQEQDCRDLAERLGWQVATVHVDNDLSAYSGKPRPGYKALLDDITAGRVDAVLAWHTDRLHRSPVELEDYIKVCEPRSVPTHTVKAGPLDLSAPSGRMVARQLGAVARYEVEHMQERQQRAKLQAATNGTWNGGRRPYGFEADGVTIRESEAQVIRAASEAVLAGRSLASLAKDLNDRGLRTSTGAEWGYGSLRRVLIRRRNAGLMQHRGEEIGPAVWPAIVPEDQWRAVRAALTDSSRRTTPGNERRWLMSGLALCGVCGETVRASSAGKGGRGHRPAYRCRVASGSHIVRDAPVLDDFIGDVIVERLRRDDAGEVLRQDQRVDTTELHIEAVAVRQRLTDLAAMYADGEVDARQLREGSERLRTRLDDIEQQIADASRSSTLHPFTKADPGVVWDGLDLAQKRAVVNTLMTVTIHRTRKGRPPGWKPGQPYFDPGSIEIAWKTT
jgi:DNA invertase Pin-like site-specific DNA recombinase